MLIYFGVIRVCAHTEPPWQGSNYFTCCLKKKHSDFPTWGDKLRHGSHKLREELFYNPSQLTHPRVWIVLLSSSFQHLQGNCMAAWWTRQIKIVAFKSLSEARPSVCKPSLALKQTKLDCAVIFRPCLVQPMHKSFVRHIIGFDCMFESKTLTSRCAPCLNKYLSFINEVWSRRNTCCGLAEFTVSIGKCMWLGQCLTDPADGTLSSQYVFCI